MSPTLNSVTHDEADVQSKDSKGNAQAAIARTVTRAMALYFSRPVRLFRPSKVSGWQSLKGLASKDGVSLSPQYVVSLMRNHGFMLIPKHFVPPMTVNALLGTVLWAGYSESFDLLSPHIGHHPILTAACSGAIAGGMQAVVAAPAENVRLLFSGENVHHSWSHAWKEVFRGTTTQTKEANLEEIRQVRSWMKDVKAMGDMASRGWNGWGWGVAKDMCGFAVFFSIFEVTRRLALDWKDRAQQFQELHTSQANIIPRNISRITHGGTLVAGGVVAGLAYEFTGRPWDVARRVVELKRLSDLPPKPAHVAILEKIREEGPMYFLRDPSATTVTSSDSNFISRRVYAMLRTLGRVGPWGIGFLVWEIYGPGLTS